MKHRNKGIIDSGLIFEQTDLSEINITKMYISNKVLTSTKGQKHFKHHFYVYDESDNNVESVA